MPPAWAGALVRGRSWWRTTLAVLALAALVGTAVEADTASSATRQLRATNVTALPVTSGDAPPSWVSAEPRRSAGRPDPRPAQPPYRGDPADHRAGRGG